MSMHIYYLYFCLFILITCPSMFAKKISGKAHVDAAPAWDPSSEESDEIPVLTRRFHKPAPFPSLPLPPIDPEIDVDDRSILVAANRHSADRDDTEEIEATTETINIRNPKHKIILPISEQISDASGEEDSRSSVMIPSSISTRESDETPSRTVLIPVDTDSRTVELMPSDESDASNNLRIQRPPGIKPSILRTLVKVRRPKPVPPRPIPPSSELESEELVPIVETTTVKIRQTVPPLEKSKSEEEYTKIPKKLRKMYKVYRPGVIEVDRGPYSRKSPRPVYIAKRPPILVEEIEIPEKYIKNLHRYDVSDSTHERTLRKGSGQFPPNKHSYRRAYRLQTTTPVSSPKPKRCDSTIKRLLYNSRFATTTVEPYEDDEIPLEIVYDKSKPSSYREIIVKQKHIHRRPLSMIYRKQAKNYPKHQRYSKYPSEYQQRLIKRVLYGYS